MKRIVVLGAGESGVGSAILALKKGFDVFVSDMSAIKDKYKKELDQYGIAYEENRKQRQDNHNNPHPQHFHQSWA